MKEYVDKFSVNTMRGEIIVESYCELKKDSHLDYTPVPIYKIGDDLIDFSGQASTFIKHKEAVNRVLQNKKIDFPIDHSWDKGFKILNILGRGRKVIKNKISELDYFKAFFYYQVVKGSDKLKKYYIETPENKKIKKEKIDTIKERAKLAQLILSNNMKKEDVELITETVLSLSV